MRNISLEKTPIIIINIIIIIIIINNEQCTFVCTCMYKNKLHLNVHSTYFLHTSISTTSGSSESTAKDFIASNIGR